jgi:hypothetical protein
MSKFGTSVRAGTSAIALSEGLAEVAQTPPMIAIVDVIRLVEGASDDSILDSCGDDSR